MTELINLTKEEKRKERQHSYYEKNKDKIKARSREWALAHPEKERERGRKKQREWRKNHKKESIEILKKWKNENPQKVKDAMKKYYNDHQGELSKKYKVKYSVNKEEIKKRVQLYYLNNLDKCREYIKNYKLLNPEKYSQMQRDCQRKRRALKRNVLVEKFSSMEIFNRDNWICQLCGEKVDKNLKWPDPKSASLDHIIPLSKGGHHSKSNSQLAHLLCNIIAGVKGRDLALGKLKRRMVEELYGITIQVV